jgi:hypothetical protein
MELGWLWEEISRDPFDTAVTCVLGNAAATDGESALGLVLSAGSSLVARMNLAEPAG